MPDMTKDFPYVNYHSILISAGIAAVIIAAAVAVQAVAAIRPIAGGRAAPGG